jgi:hypothetical protein
MIGKILSTHNQRRDDIIWMASLRGEVVEEELSKKGICEVNLENNKITDRSAQEFLDFFKDDHWTRCLNLRSNRLTNETIKQFGVLLKKNTSLISLDLRDNFGFTKELSVYIFKKLKRNL